jgi:hypothetical protein
MWYQSQFVCPFDAVILVVVVLKYQQNTVATWVSDLLFEATKQ